MDEMEVTAEDVGELLKPKDELAQAILKYESKYLSHRDTLTNGLYSVNEIPDVTEHLLFVRNVSKKEFAALFKRDKLTKLQNQR